MKKNILANIIGRFWSILSSFLFIPLYIKFLGFDSYSIISFTLLIAGIMVILDAGLTATLSREFARTDNALVEKLKVFKTLEFIYLTVITIAIAVIFFCSELIATKWLNLTSYNPREVTYFLKIISFDIGFQLLFRFYSGGLLGLEKQVKANAFQVGWGAIRNGLVVVLIMITPSLEFFFWWQTFATVVFAILIKLSLEKELYGMYKLDIKFNVDPVVFNRVWRFAGGMMAIVIVSALNTQMDKIVISKFLSLENLGYYTLAISLSQGIVILVNPIATALLPRFTALYTNRQFEGASDMFNKFSLIVSILVFTLMANMIFFANDLIWIWTGKVELAQKISQIIPIVALAYTMIALQVLPYNIAIANGYTKLNNILGIVSLFITIPGYWIAVQYFGAIGAASVFCLVQVVTTIVYVYFINKKFINAGVFKEIYFKQIIAPITLSLLAAYLFSMIPNLFQESRILSLLWIGLSTALTLLTLCVVLIPFQDIKNTLKLTSNYNKKIKK